MAERQLPSRFWLMLIILLLTLASSSWLALAYFQARLAPPRLAVDTTIRLAAPTEALISLANVNQITPLARWGKGRASQIAYEPTGQWLALASSQGIFLYDAETLAEAASFETDDQVWSMAFSADGQLLAAGLANKTVLLWQVADRKLMHTLSAPAQNVKNLAFSPDGRLLAVGSTNQVTLWQVTECVSLSPECREPLRMLTGPPGVLLKNITFSPDGALLAAGAWNNDAVQLWQVGGCATPSEACGAPLSPLQGPAGTALSVAFSPQDDLLAVGTASGAVRLWQVSTGSVVGALEGHTAGVNSLAFSADGARLVSGSADGTVRLWQISTGALLHTFEGQAGSINSLSFSPD
ncbi:MAG TPA: WD40 repeat domain-containing protein, partial [Anaerolineae bacterium]|nr:WD40 repeat domain-containing protein [Anaerolineae bacterium]